MDFPAGFDETPASSEQTSRCGTSTAICGVVRNILAWPTGNPWEKDGETWKNCEKLMFSSWLFSCVASCLEKDKPYLLIFSTSTSNVSDSDMNSSSTCNTCHEDFDSRYMKWCRECFMVKSQLFIFNTLTTKMSKVVQHHLVDVKHEYPNFFQNP